MIFANQKRNSSILKAILLIVLSVNIFNISVSTVRGQDTRISSMSADQRFILYTNNNNRLNILEGLSDPSGAQIAEAAETRAFMDTILTTPFDDAAAMSPGETEWETEYNAFIEASMLAQFDARRQANPDDEAVQGRMDAAERRLNNRVSEVNQVKQTSLIDCGWTSPFSCHVANLSYHVVFNPVAGLMVSSGRLFDFVMGKTVVNMKDTLFGQENTSINDAWSEIRDYVNVLFIFVLLWISIKTIIYGTGNTGKEIIKVIIIALLINFSLLFTKAFIDVGNVLSISMYETARNNTSITIENEEIPCKISNIVRTLLGTDDTKLDGSIACSVIANTGVASSFNNIEDDKLDYMKVIIKSLGGSVLMIIISVVLFIMSFMLVGRLIVLAFVLFTSAAAFAGYMLPQLKSKITDPWKKALVGQTFFPFVLLLMLDISLSIMRKLTSASNWKNLQAGIMPDDIFNYVIIIALLITSLTVAKMVANSSGGMASKVTGYASNSAKKAIGFGLTGSAAAARFGIGGSGRLLAKNANHDSALGRAAMRTGNFLANRSFDIKNLPGMKQLGMKGGGKGGFNKTAKDWADKTDKKMKAKQEMYGSLSGFEEREKNRIRASLEKGKEERNAKKSEYATGIKKTTKQLDKEKNNLKEMKSDGRVHDDTIKEQEDMVKGLETQIENLGKSMENIGNQEIVVKGGFMGAGKPTTMTVNDAEKRTSNLNDAPKARKESFAGRLDPINPGILRALSNNTLTSQAQKWGQQQRKLSEKERQKSPQEKQVMSALQDILSRNETKKESDDDGDKTGE